MFRSKELEAKLTQHFQDDDRRFGELKDSVNTLVPAVTEVKDKLNKKQAADEAVAEVTKAAAAETQQQVSAKQFYITIAVGVLTIIGSVVAAFGASGHLG